MKKMIKICTGMMAGAVLLTGCGSASDAAADKVVKAYLDVAYGKSVEEYADITGTKKEDAEKYSEQALKAEADALQAYYGMDTEGSEKTEKAFEEICSLLFDKAEYNVTAKGDEVTVSFKPVTALESEAVTQYVDDFNVKEFVDGDTSCTDEAFAEGLLEVLKKDGVEVSDKEETVTVSVSEKDGKKTVSSEELSKIDEAVLVYED